MKEGGEWEREEGGGERGRVGGREGVGRGNGRKRGGWKHDMQDMDINNLFM